MKRKVRGGTERGIDAFHEFRARNFFPFLLFLEECDCLKEKNLSLPPPPSHYYIAIV